MVDRGPLLEPRRWAPVPGAESCSIFPLIDKPGLRSSNVYIIHTPGCFLVIDIGSNPDHPAEAAKAAREAVGQAELPVIVLLTHCHYDHCGHLIHRPVDLLSQGRQYALLHWQGAETLAAADSRATMADVGEVDITPFRAEARFFEPGQIGPRELDFIAPGAFLATGDTGSLPCQVLVLPGGVELDILHTPGHSPDSCCYRLGDLLFVGDVPVATAPFTAGIHGWKADVLRGTLESLISLLDNRGRRMICLPGHGEPLGRDKARAVFDALARQCAGLDDLEPCDGRRIAYFSDYGGALLRQINDNFEQLAELLERLARRMSALEEFESAQQCQQLFDQSSARRYLEQYELMRVAYRSGRHSKVEMSFEALHTAIRLGKLLDYERLGRIVDPMLLGRLRQLLDDFKRAAQGLRFAEISRTADLNRETARVVRQSLDPFGPDPDSTDDVPGGEEAFREYLLRRLASADAFPRTELVCAFDEQTPLAAPLLLPRFDHCLNMLLAHLAAAGARRISLGTNPGSGRGPALELEAVFDHPPSTPAIMTIVRSRRWLPTAAMDGTLSIDQRTVSMRLTFREESALPH